MVQKAVPSKTGAVIRKMLSQIMRSREGNADVPGGLRCQDGRLRALFPTGNCIGRLARGPP